MGHTSGYTKCFAQRSHIIKLEAKVLLVRACPAPFNFAWNGIPLRSHDFMILVSFSLCPRLTSPYWTIHPVIKYSVSCRLLGIFTILIVDQGPLGNRVLQVTLHSLGAHQKLGMVWGGACSQAE